MRLAVYTDYAYRQRADGVFAERAFSLFLAEIAPLFSGFLLLGRLGAEDIAPRYRIPEPIEFVPLPYYPSLARPLSAARAMLRSLGGFWGALGRVDAVWLLGPHPLAIAFAVLAAIRGRRVAIGVRQDLPEYVRTRHPKRKALRVAAWVLEAIYRLMARSVPTVVVGPQLARRYRSARALHELTVSLIRADGLASVEDALARRRSGGPTIVSVGRLESEKNPLLLIDVAAELSSSDEDWRLLICGEGPLEDELRRRIIARGLEEHVVLKGYVPFGEAMLDIYRQADCLLHVSWTEGLPQVLVEAMAVGLPVVGTDVGGIRDAVGDSALLVPPGDAAAAADAIRRVRADARLRERLVRSGLRFAAEHTLESEARALTEFLIAAGRRCSG